MIRLWIRRNSLPSTCRIEQWIVASPAIGSRIVLTAPGDSFSIIGHLSQTIEQCHKEPWKAQKANEEAGQRLFFSFYVTVI
jgi:hypothetical protein